MRRLNDHLDQTEPKTNNRNGYARERLQTEDGEFELATPRDRNADFEPPLVKKPQRRFAAMDDKILFLYAEGQSSREIVTAFDEMYGADISPALFSKVTDAAIY